MSFTNNSPVNAKPVDPKLDAMFSGLGLDNYLSNSPVHAPAQPAAAAVPAADTVKDNGVGQLSLQEKQRLVFKSIIRSCSMQKKQNSRTKNNLASNTTIFKRNYVAYLSL